MPLQAQTLEVQIIIWYPYDISYNVNLVQLRDTSGNVKHAVIVFGYFIFDSNSKLALPIFLNKIVYFFAPYKEEADVFDEF